MNAAMSGSTLARDLTNNLNCWMKLKKVPILSAKKMCSEQRIDPIQPV